MRDEKRKTTKEDEKGRRERNTRKEHEKGRLERTTKLSKEKRKENNMLQEDDRRD